MAFCCYDGTFLALLTRKLAIKDRDLSASALRRPLHHTSATSTHYRSHTITIKKGRIAIASTIMYLPSLITLIIALMAMVSTTVAFAPMTRVGISHSSSLLMAETSSDDDEIVACRIIVTGAVQGGYYRSCVLNEVSSVVGSASSRRSVLTLDSIAHSGRTISKALGHNVTT